jgi:hypothetical protein
MRLFATGVNEASNTPSPLVHDDVFFGFELEMGQIERADGVHRRHQHAVAVIVVTCRPQFGANLTQGPQHTSAIEALSLTMFAKAHRVSLCELLWVRRCLRPAMQKAPLCRPHDHSPRRAAASLFQRPSAMMAFTQNATYRAAVT